MTIQGIFTAAAVQTETIDGYTHYKVDVVVEGKSKPVTVTLSYKPSGELCNVTVNTHSAAARAWSNGMGKWFNSEEEALNNYKEGGKVHRAVVFALELIHEAQDAARVEEEEVVVVEVVEAPVKAEEENTVAPDATLQEIRVNWAEGRTGELEGSYPTVAAFEAAVKRTTIWKENSGAKCGLTLIYTDGSEYTLKYDFCNYLPTEGYTPSYNGVVDLIADVKGRYEWHYTQKAKDYYQSEEARLQDVATYRSFYEALIRETSTEAPQTPVQPVQAEEVEEAPQTEEDAAKATVEALTAALLKGYGIQFGGQMGRA